MNPEDERRRRWAGDDVSIAEMTADQERDAPLAGIKQATDDVLAALLSNLENLTRRSDWKESPALVPWREVRAALMRDPDAPLPPT